MAISAKRQPQGLARLARTNPIARGLALLVTASGGATPYDLVGRRGISAGAQTRGVSPMGYAYSNALANAGTRLAGNTRLLTSDGIFTGDFSISLYANPASSGTVTVPFGVIQNAAPESYFVFNGTLGASASAGTVSYAMSQGGAPGGVTAANVIDGNFHMFTVLRRAGMMEMWVDKRLVNTSANAVTLGAAACRDTLFGYDSGGYGCAFQTPLLFAHNRALSPGEISSLADAPWQLLDAGSQSQFPQIAATGGAGATATPTGVSTTSSVGSATASGTAKAAPLGVSAAASVGTAAASANATAQPLGVSATASVGTATAQGAASSTAQPAGVAAAATVGAASASGQAKAAPAGVSATSTVGTAVATGQAIIYAFPAGVQAVASVGIATGKGNATAAPLGVQSQIYVGAVYAYGPFDASSYPKFYAFTLMRADPVSASGAMQGSSAQFTLMRSNPLYAASAMSDAPLNRSVNLI